MLTFDDRLLAALRTLLRSSHLAGPDDLPGVVTEACAHLGASAQLYLVDYDQVVLVPLLPPAQLPPVGVPVQAVSIDATLAGRSFSDVTPHVTTAGEGVCLWVPVVDGTDRLGVLQMQFPEGQVVDSQLQDGCVDVASLLAELVQTKSAYGDLVERTRRRVGMTVPAELQWTQLPPLTFVSERVGIAGVLAPSAEVAGDSFDYALNGETAYIALFDAMGHGLQATLLSAVAVSALRNARRGGLGLEDTVRAIEAELDEQFGDDEFVTAIVGELDVATGWWRWATCGHPPVLLVRGGQVVKVLDELVSPPLGLGLLEEPPQIGQERLQPGDRLVLYSDGVVEARDAEGRFFGTERLIDFVTKQAVAARPVAETLRRLNMALLDHQEGALQDDATTVLLEWLTPQAEPSTP